MWRVLRPGGIACLAMPNERHFFLGRMWEGDWQAAHYDDGHYYLFDKKEEVSALFAKGWELLQRIDDRLHKFTFMGKPLERTLALLERPSLTTRIAAPLTLVLRNVVKRILKWDAQLFSVKPVVHRIYLMRKQG